MHIGAISKYQQKTNSFDITSEQRSLSHTQTLQPNSTMTACGAASNQFLNCCATACIKTAKDFCLHITCFCEIGPNYGFNSPHMLFYTGLMPLSSVESLLIYTGVSEKRQNQYS